MQGCGEDGCEQPAGDPACHEDVLRPRRPSSGSGPNPLLIQAVGAHPEDAELLSAMAALHVVQQRLDEASRALPPLGAIETQPSGRAKRSGDRVSGEAPDARRGVWCVEDALHIGGPQPNLLDTKGTVLVHQGKATEAVPLLLAATSANPIRAITCIWPRPTRASARPTRPGRP